MRSLTLALLVVVTACASSRVRGDGDDDGFDAAGDDVDGAGLDDAAVDVPLDATPVTPDAPDAADVAPCTSTSGVETIQEWQQPDGGRLTAPPALALGPDGELVAAYNVDAAPLVLATRAPGGAWPALALDTNVGSMPSLAFAPDGTLHVCYVWARPFERGPLKCASRPPAGSWSTVTVDQNPVRAPSVTIDPFGRLNVSYSRDEGVAVAQQSSGGGWSTYVMTVGAVDGTSLAYSVQGREHVVWSMWSGGWPAIFERATGLVDGDFAWVTPRSLAVDGAGRVHVAFASNNTLAVTYAYRDADNVWHYERDLDGDGEIVPWSIALATGEGGAVHVAYYARQAQLGQPNEVRLATRAPGGGWSTEVLHRSPDYYPRVIAMTARDGAVHVAFDSATFGPPYLRHVYYARRCSAADPP
ncbi:MAG: hypothetical protein K8M05_13710 [Deltaproteobacteria bacterium]|nr:hypothetical protein [Kofleriaceae bacterium]